MLENLVFLENQACSKECCTPRGASIGRWSRHLPPDGTTHSTNWPSPPYFGGLQYSYTPLVPSGAGALKMGILKGILPGPEPAGTQKPTLPLPAGCPNAPLPLLKRTPMGKSSWTSPAGTRLDLGSGVTWKNWDYPRIERCFFLHSWMELNLFMKKIFGHWTQFAFALSSHPWMALSLNFFLLHRRGVSLLKDRILRNFSRKPKRHQDSRSVFLLD